MLLLVYNDESNQSRL